MTNPVTRYTCRDGRMTESETGGWVHYDNYSNLQAAYDQMVRHHAKAHGVPVVEPRCDATWQPVVDGPVLPCTLPAGHTGKHRAPEPFTQDGLLRVTRGQMDYTTAVVGNAIDSGMTKEQFLTMVNIGWDAREKVRSALNRGDKHGG
jgi:hypothetical protein